MDSFLKTINANDLNNNLPQPKKKKVSKKTNKRKETKKCEHCLEEHKNSWIFFLKSID